MEDDLKKNKEMEDDLKKNGRTCFAVLFDLAKVLKQFDVTHACDDDEPLKAHKSNNCKSKWLKLLKTLWTPF